MKKRIKYVIILNGPLIERTSQSASNGIAMDRVR